MLISCGVITMSHSFYTWLFDSCFNIKYWGGGFGGFFCSSIIAHKVPTSHKIKTCQYWNLLLCGQNRSDWSRHSQKNLWRCKGMLQQILAVLSFLRWRLHTLHSVQHIPQILFVLISGDFGVKVNNLNSSSYPSNQCPAVSWWAHWHRLIPLLCTVSK